jgi:hypothetical protein
VYAFDPLEDDAPEGAVVYARVRPMGARPRLTDGHLAQIAERLLRASAELTFVAIESEQAPRDARRLSKMLAEVGADLATNFELSEDEDEASDEDESGDEEDTERVDGDDGDEDDTP